MKKIFAFAVVALMMLAIPAAAANYKLSGTFSGGYDYANGAGTDNLGLTLAFNFDEAGLMTAYAPVNLVGGFGIASGWWAKFATAPLNVIISDNSATGYKWSSLETTFGMLVNGISSNRYSKVWGLINPNLSYAAQASMDEVTDYYSIAAQLGAKLPLGLTLTSDFGWLKNVDGYNMGLSTALTGAIPVIGGTFKVAVGNFADLDLGLVPPLYFWNTDDAWAFAAYAGVMGIKLGPVTIDEVSYKMGMNGIYDSLLNSSTTSFYKRDLQEVTTNATAVLGPVTVVFKNAVWFQSFNPFGGDNANLDVSAALGGLKLGLNIDAKLNWVAGFVHGEKATLRAEFNGLIGKLGGTVGYNMNWDGVGQYVVDPTTGYDKAFGTLYYQAPFGLLVEAYGDYDQHGTDTATAGIYAKYENTYTAVPYVVDLKALVAGRFGYVWTEVPSNDMEAIGMLKVDSTIDAQWTAGLLFITKTAGSPALSFEPIASVYAKYKATDMVTISGTVTYRYSPMSPSPVSMPTGIHNVYTQLKGDIKISDNATASVYWGQTGLASVSSSHADYSKPWGPYFNTVAPMAWDAFGANFAIKF